MNNHDNTRADMEPQGKLPRTVETLIYEVRILTDLIADLMFSELGEEVFDGMVRSGASEQILCLQVVLQQRAQNLSHAFQREVRK